MLRLYFKTDNTEDLNIIKDVNNLFNSTKLTKIESIKEILEKIELGKWNDTYSFIDRFGFKLDLKYISTGSKAIICIFEHPNKIISLEECGKNVREYIFTNCRDGNILLNDDELNSMQVFSEIYVRVDNYVFTNFDRLKYYLDNERFEEPNMNLEGIDYV